jgi:ammonia channel protein AmtB
MSDGITALQVLFTETYYWITIVMMFLIHVGFCTYEGGVSRRKSHLATLLKNTMVIPTVGVSLSLRLVVLFLHGERAGITGGLCSPFAEPWNELMAAHMGGKLINLTPADTAWGAPTALLRPSALPGRRPQSSGRSRAREIRRVLDHAVMLGSVTWIIDAAWCWHPAGWMVQLLVYHDAYSSGVVHAIAGGTCLAVLINLGPRIGKFRADGTARNIPPQNVWLVCIGLFLIYTGFWGFYAACNIPIYDVQPGDGVFWSATNIYLQPTTLSAITFNFIMALCGGLMAGYIVSKADAYWTFSGGLAGVIATSAGNDLAVLTVPTIVRTSCSACSSSSAR